MGGLGFPLRKDRGTYSSISVEASSSSSEGERAPKGDEGEIPSVRIDMHKKRPFSVHILRDVYKKRPFLVHIRSPRWGEMGARAGIFLSFGSSERVS